MSAHPPSDEGPTAVAPKQSASANSAGTTAFRVTIVEGPDAGRSFTLDGALPSPMLIGQSPSCEVRLGDRHASRRHAAIDLAGARVHLVDLGSTNGTLVNGVSVIDAYLQGGETIRVGETALRVERERERAVVPLSTAGSFGRVIGASPEMRRLYPLCEKLAASNIPLVIEGETGTGKELLAEAIHEEGPRAAGPFIVFDCTAVPPGLVESELFGHEKGAFTGAVATRKGVFELAHGGTLLIDEIGDLDPTLQPKLLRAVERAEARRVGGDRPIRVDVRLLCATRRNLDHEVQAGRFRDDLFHRLAVTRIELPPLRRRRGDVAVLARAIARQLGGGQDALPERVLLRWEDYAWPGNVRELRNAVARFLALGDSEFGQDRAATHGVASGAASSTASGAASANARDRAQAEPSGANGASGSGALEKVLSMGLPFRVARGRVLQEFERGYLERVLAEHGGNILRAAAASGIARRHLQRVRARMASNR
jgi:DNA-binding NtrC family response regulator